MSADSQRKWPEMMQVHYDEPSRVSEQPLALIEKNNDLEQQLVDKNSAPRC